MALAVPSEAKVYTTKYENFKGVDYTNDPTNVWYRRSPTGTNMLPDAAGRPFKRNGWEILLSQHNLLDALSLYDYAEAEIDEDTFNGNKAKYYTMSGVIYTQCTQEDVFDENETYYERIYTTGITILKCAYFELAGKDHIVIFTDAGVIFYNGGVTATETDYDCRTSYDRCFFFEGNGVSAFYIYANFKVWRYSYDPTDVNAVDGFAFELLEKWELTIPTIIGGASSEGVGTTLDGFNLLGELASIEYNDDILKTWWCSDGLTINVPSSFATSVGTTYHWRYNSSQNPKWVQVSGGKSISEAGITWQGTPHDDDEIFVIHKYGVLLPNNVSDIDNVRVLVSDSLQFDKPLAVTDVSPFAANTECLLVQDQTNNRANKRAWIEFGKDWSAVNSWSTTGQDFIKVTFPSVVVSTTEYNDPTDVQLQYTGSTALDIEGV